MHTGRVKAQTDVLTNIRRGRALTRAEGDHLIDHKVAPEDGSRVAETGERLPDRPAASNMRFMRTAPRAHQNVIQKRGTRHKMLVIPRI